MAVSAAERNILIGLAFALVLAFAMAWVISGRMAARIGAVVKRLGQLRDGDTTDLRQGLDRFAAGDLTVTVAPSTEPLSDASSDELGQLAEHFVVLRDLLVVAAIGHVGIELRHFAEQLIALGHIGVAVQDPKGREGALVVFHLLRHV